MIGSGLKGLTGLELVNPGGTDCGTDAGTGGTGEGTSGGTDGCTDVGTGGGTRGIGEGTTGDGTGFGVSCLESSVISPFLPMSIIGYSIQPKSVF